MKTSLAEAICLIYNLNAETKHYSLSFAPIGFNKLPFEIALERTLRPEIIRAKWVLTNPHRKGAEGFNEMITGLKPTPFNKLFHGNFREFINTEKKISFMLIQFSPDNREIKIHFFNHFKVFPKVQEKFIQEFMQRN